MHFFSVAVKSVVYTFFSQILAQFQRLRDWEDQRRLNLPDSCLRLNWRSFIYFFLFLVFIISCVYDGFDIFFNGFDVLFNR